MMNAQERVDFLALLMDAHEEHEGRHEAEVNASLMEETTQSSPEPAKKSWHVQGKRGTVL